MSLIRLVGSVDTEHKKKESAACRDVLGFYQKNVSPDPPLGRKRVFVQPAPDGIPRACVDGLPGRYIINLNCLNTLRYCQLVYQLGHELGHVWCDPSPGKSSWFVESVCAAMARLALTYMGKRWRKHPTVYKGRGYAKEFLKYHDDGIRKSANEVGLEQEGDVQGWVQEELPCIIQRGEIGADDLGRKYQLLCAVLIERSFTAHARSWGAICKLGVATRNERTDFAKWKQLVAAHESPLVEQLSICFAGPAKAEQGHPRDRPGAFPAESGIGT